MSQIEKLQLESPQCLPRPAERFCNLFMRARINLIRNRKFYVISQIEGGAIMNGLYAELEFVNVMYAVCGRLMVVLISAVSLEKCK